MSLELLEQAVLDHEKNTPLEIYELPARAERIAVIGAGIAGLSCALALDRKNYRVSVFEKQGSWGGRLCSHPSFPLFDMDIKRQFVGSGCIFEYGRSIDSLEELAGFSAVVLAMGSMPESWRHGLSDRPDIFVTGGAAGLTVMESLARGAVLSRQIEAFFRTGKRGSEAEVSKTGCSYGGTLTGMKNMPAVLPSKNGSYTEEEARTEAGRCMHCDCRDCMQACEMLRHYRKPPKKIASDIYSDMHAAPPISNHVATRLTYSCNDCGYCRSICPQDVNVGDLLRESRSLRTQDSQYPRAWHEFWLRDMAFHSEEAAFFFIPEGAKTLFFPGCQLIDSYPGHVEQAYELLCIGAKCGLILGCCGAPAFWAGEQDLFAANLARLRSIWMENDCPELVFACPTCERILAEYIPEARHISLYELIASDRVQGRLQMEAAIFDPCSAREDKQVQQAVRSLAKAAGVDLRELPETGRCCGYGGQMRVANPSLYEEIKMHRSSASALPYVVYCANCREVLASAGKECRHILDIVFDLEGQPAPSLDQKRQNALLLKAKASAKLTGIDFLPTRQPWHDINIKVTPALQTELDNRLISADDVRRTIYSAEQQGWGFIDEDSGVVLSWAIMDAVTYWVEYREQSEVYEMINAYTHRMKFRKDQ